MRLTLLFVICFHWLACSGAVYAITASPVCLEPSTGEMFDFPGNEYKVRHRFEPIIYYENLAIFGFDAVDLYNDELEQWQAYCQGDQLLQAKIGPDRTDALIKHNNKLFPGRLNGRFVNAHDEDKQLFVQSLLGLLIMIRNAGGDELVSRFLDDMNNPYRLLITTHGESSHVNFARKIMVLNVTDTSQTYDGEDGQKHSFTVARLAIHELLHATYGPATLESQIVTMTNGILAKLKIANEPRDPETVEQSNDSDKAFALPARQPTRAERFNTWITQRPQDFVTDYRTYVTAGSAAIGLAAGLASGGTLAATTASTTAEVIEEIELVEIPATVETAEEAASVVDEIAADVTIDEITTELDDDTPSVDTTEFHSVPETPEDDRQVDPGLFAETPSPYNSDSDSDVSIEMDDETRASTPTPREGRGLYTIEEVDPEVEVVIHSLEGVDLTKEMPILALSEGEQHLLYARFNQTMQDLGFVTDDHKAMYWQIIVLNYNRSNSNLAWVKLFAHGEASFGTMLDQIMAM